MASPSRPGCRETSPPFRPSWEPGPPRLPRTKPPDRTESPESGESNINLALEHIEISILASRTGVGEPSDRQRPSGEWLRARQPQRQWRPLSGPAPGTARRSRPEPPPGDLAHPSPSGPERGCGLGQRHVGSAISRVIRWRIARDLQGRRAARLLRRGGLAPGPRPSCPGPQR